MQQNIKTKTKANELDYHIGQTVKRLRKLNGYSQQDLANMVNVTFQQIQKYENGKNRISASRLYEIMSEFNIQPSDFFYLLDERTNKKQNSSLFFDQQAIEMIALLSKIQNPEQKDTLIKFVKDWIKKTN